MYAPFSRDSSTTPPTTRCACGYSAEARDRVLTAGGLEATVYALRVGISPEGLRMAAWLIRTCLKFKEDDPSIQGVADAIAAAAWMLGSEDEGTVIEAAWGLSNVCRVTPRGIDIVLAQQPLPRLINLLQREQRVAAAALAVMGNIVAGSDEQTQQVLNAGGLPGVRTLLNHTDATIRKDCCWLVGNVAAGTQEQIQALLESRCMEYVIPHLSAQEDGVRREATRAVSNALARGSPEQVCAVCADSRVIELLYAQLEMPEPALALAAVEALGNALRAGREVAQRHGLPLNMPMEHLRRHGGDKCRQLRDQHPSDEVRVLAQRILRESYGE
eukprot:TRINITY_DN8601_c0_g1_i2.p1 TRINITY_DN8601_c0_g1~~TRINITY_DN8601_c0_g1_i2.p1  ORF type:complete len:330 (+),score=76.65 TRINITY_DN8601_c0_g1_i2:450-1439(+)